MDKISLEQLEEMQKDLFKKQCDLDIQKAFVKHFIKKKKAEQLNIHSVSKSFYCYKEKIDGVKCDDCCSVTNKCISQGFVQ